MSPINPKKRLATLDNLIRAFAGFTERYPNASYGENLIKLKQERADLAAKIGTKK